MDFLLDAQGEDLVSGRQAVDGAEELALLAPELQERITAVCPLVEAEFGDAQEFELTVQDGELFLLQTRAAKRTPWAALRIAVDQVGEGLIDRAAARERIAPLDLDGIRRVRVLSEDEDQALCRALPASMGVASGPVALDVEAATRLAHEGHPPVLVRPDTTTEDIAGIALAAGVLTGTGGRTSHAAVVARDYAKPCLVGCAELEVDLDARRARIGRRSFAEGDEICLDAESGLVFASCPRLEEERPSAELATAASWASEPQPPEPPPHPATKQEHAR
jgi:pyruvate,orthophosphate dikinase